MKLYIRVKFRAAFITFGTVEHEIPIGGFIQDMARRLLPASLPDDILRDATALHLVKPIVLLKESRGVYVEVR